MKQKIDWYREVLELEPGSRVFFPLAKLLAADGQSSDAVQTLKQGLLRHPDHVEARLLLVELLHILNAGPELQTEIDGLGGLFASYPGFWKAWSERLSTIPALHDASLAMRFFAAALQGKQVSWGAIIEYGIQSVLSPGETQAQSPAFTPPPESSREIAAMRQTARSAPVTDEKVRGEDAPPKIRDTVAKAGPPESTETPEEGASIKSDSQMAVSDSDAGADEEESEEAFSLRTRSMADVLAEQGDFAGALDIYHELIRAASAQEIPLLEARVEELTKRINSHVSEESATGEKPSSPGGESSRLVTLLESLAQRLEARAR